MMLNDPNTVTTPMSGWMNSTTPSAIETRPLSDHMARYSSICTFNDPDGNGWLVQEITTRLPGRVDVDAMSYSTVNDLDQALVRAATAHGEHEKNGQADENWPAWYARYMVAEQSGAELPS